MTFSRRSPNMRGLELGVFIQKLVLVVPRPIIRHEGVFHSLRLHKPLIQTPHTIPHPRNMIPLLPIHLPTHPPHNRHLDLGSPHHLLLIPRSTSGVPGDLRAKQVRILKERLFVFFVIVGESRCTRRRSVSCSPRR